MIYILSFAVNKRKKKKKRIIYRKNIKNYTNFYLCSILRIQEHGVLRRIAERMLPEMPTCKAPTTFNSARFADVYSAFLILIVGLITAVSIGIFERIWNKRKQMQESIVRGFREHHFIPHMPHIQFHYHHRHHQHLDQHPPPHNTNRHSDHHPSHRGYHNDHSFQPYFINDHSNKPAASYFINYSNVVSKNNKMVSTNRKEPNEASNLSSIVKDRSSVKRLSSTRKRSANNMSKRAFWASFVGISQKQSKVTIDKREISAEKTIKTKNTEERKKTNTDVLPFRL